VKTDVVAAPDMPQSGAVNSNKLDADEMSWLMLIDDDMSDSEPMPPKSSEYVVNVSESAAAAAAATATSGSTSAFKSDWLAPKLSSVATVKAPSNSNTIHWGPGLRSASFYADTMARNTHQGICSGSQISFYTFRKVSKTYFSCSF